LAASWAGQDEAGEYRLLPLAKPPGGVWQSPFVTSSKWVLSGVYRRINHMKGLFRPAQAFTSLLDGDSKPVRRDRGGRWYALT